MNVGTALDNSAVLDVWPGVNVSTPEDISTPLFEIIAPVLKAGLSVKVAKPELVADVYILPLCPIPFPNVNSVPVKLAEAEFALSETIGSVVEDPNPIDPIAVEDTMKIPDVEDAGTLIASDEKDGSDVNDSVALPVVTSIVLDDITVSELISLVMTGRLADTTSVDSALGNTELVIISIELDIGIELTSLAMADKALVAANDGSALKDSNVLTISIELEAGTRPLVEDNTDSLVVAGRLVDCSKLDSVII